MGNSVVDAMVDSIVYSIVNLEVIYFLRLTATAYCQHPTADCQQPTAYILLPTIFPTFAANLSKKHALRPI